MNGRPGFSRRIGLNIPYEWWPAAPMLKELEAAGFSWVQIPAPPASVLSSPRDCTLHARAVAEALATTTLESVLHGPGSLLAGSREADRVFEGMLAYAAEIGAEAVVYHARDLPDEPSSEDRLLAETRSLARLAARAERLGVTIAIENLAPVFPGPERLSHNPGVLRSLCKRIDSERVGICLDVGHAYVAADLKRTSLWDFIEPAIGCAAVFHVHDNLGARRSPARGAGLDPLRLDLHLPPGRGTLPWSRLADGLLNHGAPLLLEIHPPHRQSPAALLEVTRELLALPAVPAAL